MRKPSTTALGRRRKLQDEQLTIGLDLGDRSSFYCVLNGAGEVVLEAKVATNPEAMKKTFEKMPMSRIALETGTHLPAEGRPAGRAGSSQTRENRSEVALADSTSQCPGTGGSGSDPGAIRACPCEDGAGVFGARADEVVW